MKRKLLKQGSAIVLSVLLLMSLIPMSAMADDTAVGQEITQEQAPVEVAVPEPEPAPAPVVDIPAAPVPEPVIAEPVVPVEEPVNADVPEEAAIPDTEESAAVPVIPEEEIAEPVEKAATPAAEEPAVQAADETAYPAVTLSKTVGGVTVTLSAPEGSLPEGVDLLVTPVYAQYIFDAVESVMESEGKVLTDAVAFDVTPIDANGAEVQPRIPVTVTFSNTALSAGDGGISVFRVADDASAVTEMPTGIATPAVQQFTTDHFTIYVAGGSTSDPNGDGSGPNTQNNRYVLEYGESVQLVSDHADGLLGYWNVTAGSGYNWTANNHTIANGNTGSNDISVTVHHYYRTGNLIPLYDNEYFYITLKPQKFIVTFMFQDAGETGFTNIQESEVYRGQSVTEPGDIDETKEVDGTTYTFYGWYTDESFQTKATLTNITADQTVYGKYTTNATIHYVKNTSDAATIPEDQESGVGVQVQLGDASCSGNSLASWNTAADGSGTSYQPGEYVEMPEGGLTLYAQWSKTTVIMRYYRNYEWEPSSWRSVTNIPTASQTTLLEEIPTRPGNYIFLGWATSPGGAPTYMPGATYYTSTEQLVNLYAKWGEVNTDYTLTAKGETLTYDGDIHTISGVEEGTPSDRHPGFVLLGTQSWGLFDVNVYAKVDTITATGVHVGHYSTPITAEVWLEAPILGFWANGEYIEVNNHMLVITPVELTVSTKAAEKLYDGTPLKADGEVSFVDSGGSVVTEEFTGEGTLVNLVKEDTLNVRSTGEQTDAGTSSSYFEVDWGTPDGWGGAATAYKYDYKIIEGDFGDLTVYYQLAFDANADGEDVTAPDPVNAYLDEESGEVSVAIPGDVPVRDNYLFVGWALDPEATAADYMPGDTFTFEEVPEEGITTLYAIWTPSYTITFDPNGGTWMGTTDETSFIVAEGEIFVIPDEVPVRDGYKFLYWEGSKYNPGDSLTVTEDHKLTAVWEEIPAASDEKTDKTPPAKTGDSSNLMLWSIILAAAFIVIIAAVIAERKRNKK